MEFFFFSLCPLGSGSIWTFFGSWIRIRIIIDADPQHWLILVVTDVRKILLCDVLILVVTDVGKILFCDVLMLVVNGAGKILLCDVLLLVVNDAGKNP